MPRSGTLTEPNGNIAGTSTGLSVLAAPDATPRSAALLQADLRLIGQAYARGRERPGRAAPLGAAQNPNVR